MISWNHNLKFQPSTMLSHFRLRRYLPKEQRILSLRMQSLPMFRQAVPQLKLQHLHVGNVFSYQNSNLYRQNCRVIFCGIPKPAVRRCSSVVPCPHAGFAFAMPASVLPQGIGAVIPKKHSNARLKKAGSPASHRFLLLHRVHRQPFFSKAAVVHTA